MSIQKQSILISIIIILFFSCKHQPVVPPDNSGITTTPTDTTKIVKDSTTKQIDLTGTPCNADTAYFTDVLPLFVSNCALSGCHNSTSKRSGYQLDSYANIIRVGLKAGSSSGSAVYNSMANGSMPQGRSMLITQNVVIKKWIDQGAKNNSCNPSYGTCDTTSVKFSVYIAPLIQNQCQGCHNQVSLQGGISLSNYTEIKNSLKGGRFWGSIAQLNGYVSMPQSGAKFSSCQLNKIDAWIKRGGLNN